MVREITAMLLGTEMVILLVTVAYFSGFSVGYMIAGLIDEKTLKVLAVITWAIHLTLPFSLHYLGGSLADYKFGLTFLLLLFVTTFLLSSFFSVLAPRFIDGVNDGRNSIAPLYGAELSGGLVAVVLILLSGFLPPVATPLFYQCALALLVGLIVDNKSFRLALTVGVVAYAFSYNPLQSHSVAFYYEKVQRIEGAKTLMSVNSAYQKVDFIQSGSDRRNLYLNGLQNYGSDSLSDFNTFLSKVPALLVKPDKALIVGSGSMESVLYLSRLAREVTTVEIDQAVIDGSRKYLDDKKRLTKVTNWNVVIDDAKRFMGETNGRYDLIVMDVPAPLTVQVGLLHSVDFYQMAKRKLARNGLMAVSLSGTFRAGNSTPITVVAGLAEVFDDLVVYTPGAGERSYALAGNRVVFSQEQLETILRHEGAGDAYIHSSSEVMEIIRGVEPMRFSDMSFPVRRSLKRVFRRITGG